MGDDLKKHISCAFLAAFLLSSGTAKADPSFGFGLTYVFGGDWAVGVRVFHDDEPESAVLALGFDYKFGSQAFRPTIGAAYLDEDFYIDFSLGYDTRLKALDYGVGVGAAFETQKPAATGGGATTAGADTAPTSDGADTARSGGTGTDTGGGTVGDGGPDTGGATDDGGTGDGGTDTGGGTDDGGSGDGGIDDGGNGDGGTDTGGGTDGGGTDDGGTDDGKSGCGGSTDSDVILASLDC